MVHTAPAPVRAPPPLCTAAPPRAPDLEHCATTQLLSNDRIPYRNDFGNEMEVSCMSAATKHKTQMLAGEYNGERVRET